MLLHPVAAVHNEYVALARPVGDLPTVAGQPVKSRRVDVGFRYRGHTIVLLRVGGVCFRIVAFPRFQEVEQLVDDKYADNS